MGEYAVGDRVAWNTVNGLRTGEIQRLGTRAVLILLSNGKSVVVDYRGITKIEL